MERILKLAIFAAVLFLVWKFGVQKFLNKPGDTAAPATQPGFVSNSCIGAANSASQAWGSGIGRFTNPPYDVDAWSIFRSDIDSKIANAQGQCACVSESCRKIQSALQDLRGLVSDLDSSIRSGSAPPGDIVQRQEAIDRQLDEARDLVKQGK